MFAGMEKQMRIISRWRSSVWPRCDNSCRAVGGQELGPGESESIAPQFFVQIARIPRYESRRQSYLQADTQVVGADRRFSILHSAPGREFASAVLRRSLMCCPHRSWA